MTVEEIERILQTVAENQARADSEFAMLLKSQNRYEDRLATISDIMRDLADKQLKNEERFAETDKRFAQLADAQARHEARMERLDASYQLLEQFVRDFRNEANGRMAETDKLFAETDKKLAALASAQARTDGQMKRTDEAIKALTRAQAKTDEQIRMLLGRNGSTTKRAAKVKKVKKDGKKGSAK